MLLAKRHVRCTHGLQCVADEDSLEFASLQWILRCGEPLGSVLDLVGAKAARERFLALVVLLEQGSMSLFVDST